MKIEDITNEGCGVSRIDGFVVFVPRALGDIVEARYNKGKKKLCLCKDNKYIKKITKKSRSTF